MEKELMLKKISDQMDILVSLFKLAYADKIIEVRKKVFEDKVMVKILEIVPEDLPVSELVSKVCREINQKERSIRYRLSDLVGMGVLKTEKVGNKSFYRLTGII